MILYACTTITCVVFPVLIRCYFNLGLFSNSSSEVLKAANMFSKQQNALRKNMFSLINLDYT